MDSNVEVRDAVVVGAGFAGLYMLHVLRDTHGLHVEVLEKGSAVGGTWFWNRYPGARCDTESYIYCYSFSKELLDEWIWERKYPTQPELQSYLEHVARKFDLHRSISFGTALVEARYDEALQKWRLTCADGRQFVATYLITGVGLLASAVHMPTFDGIEQYQGVVQHTGSWTATESDYVGKRVGLIGTGSTGVQLAPELAKVCKELVVFQRTPQFTVPARHEQFTSEDFAAVQANYESIWQKVHASVGGFPWEHNGLSAHEVSDQDRERILEELWQLGGFRFVFGSFRDVLTDRQANEYVSEFVRRKIRERVADPDLTEILLPRDHPFGAKRPIIDTDYFETYNLPHVSLVDIKHSPIQRFTPTGLETTTEQFDLDMVIFATGFDAVTGPLLRIDPQGVGGRRLSEVWSRGPASLMGLGIADFPNMFMITGPGSTFGNMPVVIQTHVDWIASCIAYAATKQATAITVDPEAQQRWMERISRESARFVSSLTDSWFTGANIPGKPRAVYFYLGSYNRYREELENIATTGFPGLSFTGASQQAAVATSAPAVGGRL